MSSLTSDARFFGLDLKQLGRQLREPWEGASHWPLLLWLSPSVSVRVLHADGQDVLWVDGRGSPPSAAAKAGAGSASFVAIEVPEDMLLRRLVRLPAMGAADRDSALALEARTASPFVASDLVWGASSTASQASGYTLVLASRKQLLEHQATLGARVPSGVVPEQWAFGEGRPIVLSGFGEQRRLAFIAKWRRNACMLLGTAAVIAACIALTPSIKLKLRANQAHAAYTALAPKAAPAMQQREALVKSADQLAALQKRLAERIDPLRLLDTLTRVIPDDAALQSIKLNGTKVTLTGYATNASSLMQLLGNHPGMRSVRAPSAATRMSGAEKESFSIEFVADPAQFGVVGGPPLVAAAPVALPSPAPVVAAPAAATQSAAVAPLPAASPAAAPAPAAAPPAKSGAAGAPRAVFGGTTPKPASSGPVAPAAPAAGGKP